MGVAQAMEGVLDDLSERPDRLPMARRFLTVHLDGLERNTERLEAGAAPPERLPALLEDLTRTAGELRRPPAHPGQDTDEVLADYGFDADEIAKLRDTGAIA